MKFARWTFTLAGIYGIVVLLPNYFLEARFGRDYPPAITHPEFFYGFTGLALVWQFAFFMIGRDPARFRPLMWVGVGEKLSFAIAAAVLYSQARLTPVMAPFAGIDALLAVLFVISWFATAQAPATMAASR